MEMEHINENTIRVLIGSEDLADRGITFLDLLGNHKEVENFFYSILEEVDIEDEFQGSDAVTFQVLPKSDGLELFISKNTAVDENASLGEMNMDHMTNYIKKQFKQDEQLENSHQVMEKTFVFSLDRFEDLIHLAREIYLQFEPATLYMFEHRYYLQVNFSLDDSSQTEIENTIARLLEFSQFTNVTSEILEEYGTVIMDRNALEITRHYFNN